LRRIVVLLTSVGLLLAFTGSALATTVHSTQSFENVVLCGDAGYFISGTANVLTHDGESASGNTNSTSTITLRDAVAVDEAGNEYSLVGAIHSGETFNANTGGVEYGGTEKLQIVSKGGGTVGSVNITTHVTAQPNRVVSVSVDFDFGNCFIGH
jgi:hypothetical protein